jgi:phenylpyruvate tautomerase PptA (4-oxalocrotonate tautomerase family)
MPLTTIDVHEGATTPERRQAISDALHSAMQNVLDIPADDRFHVFTEHPAGTMFHEGVVFGIPRDENLMFITFSFNNRSVEQKERLYAAVIRELEGRAGVTRDQVLIRVLETASENWWASGRVVNPATGFDERMDAAVDH